MAAINAFFQLAASGLAGYGAETAYEEGLAGYGAETTYEEGTTGSFMGHSMVTRMLHGDSEGNTLGRDATDAFWVVVLAFFCMCYMAWGIGANDCANNFATSWGSGALSLRTCLIIAAICEFSGAVLLGSNVAKTFRKGIADISLYEGEDGRILVIVGMTSVLFSAATWLLLSSTFGLPVSTTHSAVGGVIAFAIVTKGYDSVKWSKVALIVASWVASPLLSMIFAGITFTLIKKFILDREDSFDVTAKAAPLIMFATAYIISMFIIYKGAKGVGLHKTPLDVALIVSFFIALALLFVSIPVANYIKKQLEMKEEEERIAVEEEQKTAVENGEIPQAVVEPSPATTADASPRKPHTQSYDNSPEKAKIAELLGTAPEKSVAEKSGEDEKALVADIDEMPVLSKTEKLWCGFLWITASFESLAHGGNDVANSVGPFAAVLAANEGDVNKKSDVPLWVFFIAGVGICAGLASYGIYVMRTIGKKVTTLLPSKAFSAELNACLVILLATRLGIPISTTHASVGAVMGVGIADMAMKEGSFLTGVKQGVQWNVLALVFMSWVVTLPIVGLTTSGINGFLLPMVVPTPIV